LREPVTPYTIPLSPQSSTSLALPSKATTLEGSHNLVPRKATNALLRLIVGKGEKSTFLLVQQAQRSGDFASNTVLVMLEKQFRR
jgi:hypothetical protein